MSGELKVSGRERLQENRGEYGDVNDQYEDFAEEVEEARPIMEKVQGADSDTQEVTERGKQEATDIAREKTEEMSEKKGKIDENTQALSNEMKGYGEKESENAETASGMSGSFSGVGAEMTRSFQESAEEFHSISQDGEQLQEESNSRFEATKSRANVDFR